MVFNTSSKMKGDVEYFNNLASALDDDVIMRKFYEELMNRDLSKFNPSRDRQNNKIMDIMKEHNVHVILEFINYWKEEANEIPFTFVDVTEIFARNGKPISESYVDTLHFSGNAYDELSAFVGEIVSLQISQNSSASN